MTQNLHEQLAVSKKMLAVQKEIIDNQNKQISQPHSIWQF